MAGTLNTKEIIFFREKKSKSDKSEKRDRKNKDDKKSPKVHESDVNDVNDNEIEVIEVVEVKKAKPPKQKVSSANGHDEPKLSMDEVQAVIKDLLKDLVDNVINSEGIEHLECSRLKDTTTKILS